MGHLLCVSSVLAVVFGSGAALQAQGSVRVTPDHMRVEMPVGRSTGAVWAWNGAATERGSAEYMWQMKLDGDSTYAVAFMRFKMTDAPPQEGTFADLLRGGQATVASVLGHRESIMRGLRPTLSGQDSSLVMEIRDRSVIAMLFARKPTLVTFHILSPYHDSKTHRVPVHYQGF